MIKFILFNRPNFWGKINTWQTIEEDISSESLTFMWEVVPDIPTSLGRIKIIQDNQILDYEDESSPFTIQRTTTSTLELHENRKPLLVSVFNAPNPFNNQTTISFTVLRKTDVSINIYDCTGSHVATLEQGSLLPDTYKYLWIADHFSSGIVIAPTPLLLYCSQLQQSGHHYSLITGSLCPEGRKL